MQNRFYALTHLPTGESCMLQEMTETKARNRAFRKMFPDSYLNGETTQKADWAVSVCHAYDGELR